MPATWRVRLTITYLGLCMKKNECMTRSSWAAVGAASVDAILFCFNLFVRGKCKVDDTLLSCGVCRKGELKLIAIFDVLNCSRFPFSWLLVGPADARLFKIRIRFGLMFSLVWLTCRWISHRVQRIDSYYVRRWLQIGQTARSGRCGRRKWWKSNIVRLTTGRVIKWKIKKCI